MSNTSQPTGAMRNWHVPGIAAAVVVAVQALFVLCLAYPPLHAKPHGVPIGVAGPPTMVTSVSAPLQGKAEAFDLHRYPDANAARAAILDREVYGAIAVTPTGPNVLVASAADPKIADLLTEVAGKLGQGRAVPVSDVVPSPAKDPQGSGALTTLLPLTLLSIVLGAVLAFLAPISRALFAWCALAAGAAGLAVSGLAVGLGTFTGAYWANAGVLALLVFGIAGTSAGLTRHRLLRPVEGLFALTMLLIGIPSAGALVPANLLPQPWRAMGPGLPPAAALDALRGITFFEGAAIATSIAVLIGWAAFGALLLLMPARPRHRAAEKTHDGGRPRHTLSAVVKEPAAHAGERRCPAMNSPRHTCSCAGRAGGQMGGRERRLFRANGYRARTAVCLRVRTQGRRRCH